MKFTKSAQILDPASVQSILDQLDTRKEQEEVRVAAASWAAEKKMRSEYEIHRKRVLWEAKAKHDVGKELREIEEQTRLDAFKETLKCACQIHRELDSFKNSLSQLINTAMSQILHESPKLSIVELAVAEAIAREKLGFTFSLVCGAEEKLRPTEAIQKHLDQILCTGLICDVQHDGEVGDDTLLLKSNRKDIGVAIATEHSHVLDWVCGKQTNDLDSE